MNNMAIISQENQNDNQTQLLIKQFEQFNVEIHGTFDEPLFKANDIGDILGISQIRKTIQNLDEQCKVFEAGNTVTGLQEQWFLTEDGLYEVLFISKKPIAKQFKKWVRTLIKEIRLNSQKQLQENQNDNQTQLLIKQFEQFNIEIYGTFDKPLFKAKDIGDMLGIKNIKDTIKDYNSEQKSGVVLTDPHGRPQETNMLTAKGLYKILMKSRKPIAEKFQNWVCDLVEEIRLNSQKQLQETIQTQQKQLEFYKELTFEQVILDQSVYAMSTDKEYITKVGKAEKQTSKKRKGQLQTACVDDINILYEVKTSNCKLVEDLVHYTLHKYRFNSGREHFRCDIEYIKLVMNVCAKFVNTIGSISQGITKEELIQHLGTNIPIQTILEEPKQISSQKKNIKKLNINIKIYFIHYLNLFLKKNQKFYLINKKLMNLLMKFVLEKT